MSLNYGDDSSVSIKENTVLFKEGDPIKHLYIIVSGSVWTFKQQKNRLIPLGLRRQKHFLGETSLFDGSNHDYYAVAAENLKVIKIRIDELLSEVSDCSNWIRRIMSTLSDRLKHTHHMIYQHQIYDESFSADKPFDSKLENHLKKIIAD